MLLREAKEILKKNGYLLKEDKSRSAQDWYDEYKELGGESSEWDIYEDIVGIDYPEYDDDDWTEAMWNEIDMWFSEASYEEVVEKWGTPEQAIKDEQHYKAESNAKAEKVVNNTIKEFNKYATDEKIKNVKKLDKQVVYFSKELLNGNQVWKCSPTTSTAGGFVFEADNGVIILVSSFAKENSIANIIYKGIFIEKEDIKSLADEDNWVFKD